MLKMLISGGELRGEWIATLWDIPLSRTPSVGQNLGPPPLTPVAFLASLQEGSLQVGSPITQSHPADPANY